MSPLWTGPAPLLLASTSATRRSLLEAAGLTIETQKPAVDERAVEDAARHESLSPVELAARLAAEKALEVSRRHPDRIVLGADQVLACDGEVFHKPADREAARIQLRTLAGRTHMLHSAGTLAIGGNVVETFSDTAHLTLRPLADSSIDRYLDMAGPDVMHSVGVYRIEGFGIHLFEAVDGDHSTILGLPLAPLLSALRRLGCLAL